MWDLACHGAGPLAGWLPGRLVAHHAAHHNRDEHHAFAVSWPIVDRALGPWPSAIWRYRTSAIPFGGTVAAASSRLAAIAAAREILPLARGATERIVIEPARGAGAPEAWIVTARAENSYSAKAAVERPSDRE